MILKMILYLCMVDQTVAHATTAAPPLLPLLHALEWLTVLLRGYVRPYRQYGEGAPVIQSPPKVFTKHKYVYVIPTTSPYYNNPQALFNLYKPVHTPQPTHTPQHTSSASTTTPTQSPTTHPQSTTSSMSICAWSKTKVNTYRQRLIASDITSDVAGASLATVQFFSHTLFSLVTFWRGREGGGREGKRWRWGGGGERKHWRWGGRLKEKK